MMKRCITCILMIMIFLMCTAFAESNLSASYRDGSVYVKWEAFGDCVLTVYRNNWPMTVCSVRGEDGAAVIPVGTEKALYSVRLQSGSGCETVDVQQDSMNEPTTRPQATATVSPTVKPEMTLVPTKKPVAAATPVVTMRPVVNQGQQNSGIAAQVVSQTNAERAKHGLPALEVSSELTSAACVRAREIVELFSHTRPDGTKWSTISSMALGENIAKGHNSADRVMAAWMSSDGHRRNILRENFGSIGVCSIEVNGVIYWVQLFGR